MNRCRHARLQQRGKLLVEHEKLVALDLAALAAKANAAQAEPRLECQNVQALFLELTPEGGFALGDVNALDDLARRSAEAAAVLHP